MNNKVYLSGWAVQDNDTVKLTYKDGAEVFVRKEKFDQSFGPIVSADKETVMRDFAI